MAHILIVEDEKSINDLIAMNLELVGHTSQQVYEGKVRALLAKMNRVPALTREHLVLLY